jgi:regulator of protease activity HflC (stomatin/prohibitin superfamily)
VFPLVESVSLFVIRDQLYETTIGEKAARPLRIDTKEGLSVGLAVAVRYRIDPRRLAFVQANLPQPIERELAPPVVATSFREISPNYLVRDLFASRREEIRRVD